MNQGQRLSASLVMVVIPVKPSHNHRRVHQDHGRVLPNNSAPE
jgi:hypothetical protein